MDNIEDHTSLTADSTEDIRVPFAFKGFFAFEHRAADGDEIRLLTAKA